MRAAATRFLVGAMRETESDGCSMSNRAGVDFVGEWPHWWTRRYPRRGALVSGVQHDAATGR